MGVNLDWALVPQTRVHEWRYGEGMFDCIDLKREDEGRYGITAGKLRKLASILPTWHEIDTVAVIGSANSNQVLAAALVLRERGKKVIPFLKKNPTVGTNQFLLSLVVDKGDWRILDKQEWPFVEEMAAEFVQECARKGIRATCLPEGACTKAALGGAMTLAADIARNEREETSVYPNIFIDAGTGLSAAGLVLGFYDLHFPALVHVTLMADSEEVFLEKFRRYCGWYEEIFDRKLPDLRDRLVLHKPAFAASYGSVNAEVIAHVRKYAGLGILTDPVYSAKHLGTVEMYLKEREVGIGGGLVIHSGGTQALPGFENQF